MSKMRRIVLNFSPDEFDDSQEGERIEKTELHIYTKEEVRKARHETLRLVEWAFERGLSVSFDDAKDGALTWCVLGDKSRFGERVFHGYATRAPSDKNNKWIGRMYAIQRAVGRLQSRAEEFCKGGMRE